MRKTFAIFSAVLLLCASMTTASAEPAQSPYRPAAAATGWAMGGYPNYWTICAANGVGGTYWPNLVRKWTWVGHELNLVVQNRCDGYSITNRFTFEYYNNESDPNCAKITNNHKTWSPARGKYIWDQNPVLWVNIRSGCADNPTEYDHNVQEYVGWLLGLEPDPDLCSCVMGTQAWDRNNIRYVVLHDILDMDVVYRH